MPVSPSVIDSALYPRFLLLLLLLVLFPAFQNFQVPCPLSKTALCARSQLRRYFLSTLNRLDNVIYSLSLSRWNTFFKLLAFTRGFDWCVEGGRGKGGSHRLLLCLAKGLESFLLPCTISIFAQCEFLEISFLLRSSKVSHIGSTRIGSEVR
ncbi:hypothetical protein HOY80DRAFT_596800 [Tuber brumale]|nr:hypothetical protein HOY80DRAFT_596800 [Tuber brumale]